MPVSNDKIRTQQRSSQRVATWRPRRSIEEIEETGRYYVEPDKIPDDMSYEWKAVTCLGEVLREHQIRLVRDGAWEPVPQQRHPEIVGHLAKPEEAQQPIVIGGMMLMERPKIYTEEAQQEDRARAVERVKGHFDSIGLTERGGPPPMKPTVKRDYSVQAVPDDDE